jgi:hypothetical protein
MHIRKETKIIVDKYKYWAAYRHFSLNFVNYKSCIKIRNKNKNKKTEINGRGDS